MSKDDWDSDALDEDSGSDVGSAAEEERTSMRRASGPRGQDGEKAAKRKRIPSPTKHRVTRRVRRKVQEESEQGESEDGLELKEGQEVVGVVVKAPTTGRVPSGQISKNTLDFLTKLKNPECNDRQWFKLHEPVFRQAEKEWKDFIDKLTESMTEADPHIPYLPAKDVVHRIYRDVRFSNDKTPYKKNFSASFSRSGRKGIFAGYHLSVKPGNESLIAAGLWCPGKNELDTLRLSIRRNSRPLRQVISSPTFETYFGKARPHPKGERQNIFGRDDELKVAPKGIGKDHPDIDLLKCRSFAVTYQFTDNEVLDPEFREKAKRVTEVMRPFVHLLNEMMTVGWGAEVDEDV